MEKTDLQLIEEIIKSSNSRVVFNILTERYIKSVYLFIFKLVKNKEDAEDIAQETFVKIWKNIKKYNKDKNFKTWVFSIAKNTAVDKLRKRKAINFSSLNINNQSGDEDGGKNFNFEDSLIDTEPLPDDIFIQKEAEENLVKALGQLSSDQNVIIHLHITEELTFEEIAKILEKPMNTVKSQYKRSLDRLKQILHQKAWPPRI